MVPTHLGKERALRLSVLLAGAAVLAALLTYSWRGWYARYIVDDYCTASQLRTMGFVRALEYPREVWSGRYAYFAIKAVFESAGPLTPRITPTLLLLLLVVATLWTLRKGAPASRGLAAVLALTFVFTVVDTSPSLDNIGGSFYWETGSLTYFLPLVLFTAWVGLFGSSRSPKLLAAVSALLLLIAGGLSETSLAAQGAMTAGALLLAVRVRSHRGIWIAGAGVLATVAALVLVATAPGNQLRAAAHVARIPLPAAASRSLGLANDFLGSHVLVDGAAFLLLFVVAVVAGARSAVRAERLAGVGAIAIAAYVVAFLPAAWLMAGGPAERVLDVPNYFVTVVVVTAGLATGRYVRHRSVTIALAAFLFALTIVPLRAAVANRQTIPDAVRTAHQLDTLSALLATRRGEDVVVRAPWALRMRILAPEPSYWSNQCMSRYHGLRSLRITD